MIPVEEGASRERKVESLYKALSDLKEFPDIISIQEGSKGEYFSKKFDLPHYVHGSKSSLWVLSRFPIKDHGEMRGDEENPFCIWADLVTDEGMLRVYNMHLMSNRVTNTAEELIQDMNFQNENTWNSIRFIVSRYKYTTKKRSQEAVKLRDHVRKCPYPAILTGDGNDTPLSHTYHVLADGLKDSFRMRGTGFSTTYDSQLPLLRIDYLLGTPEIQFKDHMTHHLFYSDHYPISAGICIKSGTSS
jgi:endonuclease/exonuclease/phosphatase family metal-dependent hydrolase